MRKILLLSVALPVVGLACPALAQVSIDDDQTAPIDTGSISAPGAGDIIVSSAGTVLINQGEAAITVNSDNSVTNQGTIGATDADNTTGILITGVATGTIRNSGAITLDETFVGTDDDSDGDFDTPLAQGTGRTGILVEGSAVFTGDITNDTAGRIAMGGNNSVGIQIAGVMNGNIINTGSISTVGAQSHAIEISGTLNGDLTTAGRIGVQGEGADGIRVTGTVNGAVNNLATVTSTGFRTVTRQETEARALLDADDLLVGGSPMAIGANVTGGIVNDLVLDANNIPTRGALRSDGSAPALLVAASLDGVDNGDVTIGAVGLAADDENFGLINRGTITANGVNDGFSATGIRVEGTDINGTMRTTTIAGGILNTGTIDVTAFEGNTTGLSIGNGANAALVALQSGAIRATTISQFGLRAVGVVIEAGANVNEIRVNSLIQTNYTGTGVGGFAAGIVDESGTVDLLLNNGQILTTFNEIFPIGTEADPTDTTRRKVAVDLSANNSGATLHQVQAVDSDPDDSIDPLVPEIDGDILFGAGADTLELAGGTITGDVLFGQGADSLIVDNGASLTGAIFDSDGQLFIDVRDGLLALGADTALTLTTAHFGPAARLQLFIEPNAGGGLQSATFNASGAVTFDAGSRIAPALSGLIGDGGSFDLISANTFNFAESFSAMLDAESLPFLYNVGLTQNTGSGNLVVTLSRRSASDLGMNVNQAAVYDAWFAALSTSSDDSVTSGFAGLTSANDFFGAYNQILPEFGAAALQFTLANTDGTTGAIGNRLDAIRRGYGPNGGIWLQEIGYYMDRNSTSLSQPYTGYGLGLAVGYDIPFAGFDAVGISLSGFSNQITQSEGFDTPLSSVSVQLGGYMGRKFGGFDFITHSAIGYDSFDSERNLKFGGVDRTAVGDWNAYHLASTTRLSRDIAVGKWRFSPSVSLDFLRLVEQSYTEAGGGVGVDLSVNSRTSETISATAAMTLGRRFGTDRSWWAPLLRVGVRNDIKGDSSVTTARFSGFNTEFNLTPETLPDTAILLGFSMTAGSRYTSFGFDFDTDVRDGFIRHTGKVVIRFIF